ncbi:MAG TPA: inositol monophosphatase family protein [Candidatus Acidoferrales bacterium]|nr:inositol monophosphatase family protein [Candidatus Acidoferrales bacterium]
MQVALAVAEEAGALLLERLSRPREIHEKARRADLVTDADRASEALVVARLRDAFPRAAILAEESGVHRGTADERWIVDPLDGTTNFAHGYPLFCVSIAYERSGELIAGAINAPAMRECFAAELGSGARLNGRPVAVSSIAELAGAMTCTGFHPADFARNARNFAAVSARAQAVRRDGSAALDLAYVACGRFDGFWEFDLNPWDVAAGTLIVREAGGAVTRADGETAELDARSILATNGKIHAELRRALAAS